MHNSKLADVLRTFSTKEMRLLADFVSSPYHNKNKTIISFFSIMAKDHPSFNSKNLGKKKLFQSLFGKNKFDDVKIRGLLSDTLELAEQFLAFENMKKQGFSSDPFLLHELNTRNLDVLFEIRSKKMLAPGQDPVQDKWFFLNRFLVSAENSDELWKLNDSKKEKLVGANLFENTLNQLTEFYAYEAMRILTRMTILQYTMEYPDSGLANTDKLLQFFESMENPPGVFSYLKLFQRVATRNDDAAYGDLKDMLLNQTTRILARHEILTGFDLLLVYCYSNNAKGSRNYVKDTFSILQKYQELGLHLENGFMEDAHFINMIIVALKNSEIEWAKKYISANESFLRKENRENIINYCKGSIAEVEKKHKEALTYLNQVSNPPLLINMNIKAMLIKIYYEKGDLNQVMNTCNSFNKFLRNNSKLSVFQKKIWRSFVDSSILLAKIKSGTARIDLAQWIEDVESKGEMIVKAWVLKKAKELKETN
ncbi:MAG: hypothetical protein FD123_1028 [Bacteroidetes bacterium]|nr:MAG: hypothetical protein FD123_1028 [Bacteroidota bacterium]